MHWTVKKGGLYQRHNEVRDALGDQPSIHRTAEDNRGAYIRLHVNTEQKKKSYILIVANVAYRIDLNVVAVLIEFL